MITIDDPTRAVLKNGRIVIEQCTNCLTKQSLSQKETGHEIILTSYGVTAEPDASCPECGLVYEVRNNQMDPYERESIPPGDYLRANAEPENHPHKVEIDATGLSPEPTTAYPDKDECPEILSHGWKGRVGRRCEVCGTRFDLPEEEREQ